ETTFSCEKGKLVVTDCVPIHEHEGKHGPVAHQYHELIRYFQCVGGEVEVVIEFKPRFDYGITIPAIEMLDVGLFSAFGGADALILQTEVRMAHSGPSELSGRLRLRRGEDSYAVITHVLPHLLSPHRINPGEIAKRIDDTLDYWRQWSGRLRYEGPYRDQVERSALVLKALTNAPTGSILAAATTSLPEEIGGVRNWDYRYAWLRDAALNVYALFSLGYKDEAHAFMQWVKRTTAGRAQDVQIMYGAGGERFLPEVELWDLDGYRGSRPVRIGNGAVNQFQLDVYGELLDTAWLYHRHDGVIDEFYWDFLRRSVDLVSKRWEEPDHGIWEVRGGLRDFVFSKIMAWVAVDRGIRLARALGLPCDLPEWKALRRRIRKAIETRGIDPETGSFVQSFGSKMPDAACLLAPLVRFLPADDPRVIATIKRVEKDLTRNGLVYRYLTEDGLPGGEGAFVMCSFWLVDNLALCGEKERATELFEQLLGYANDVGLLAEEINPENGELLGNFPQAFSHVGLIGAAKNLLGEMHT
ncbi:MAG: glycoside hydrolase family 15 protein, partial [Actinomycetota bacterium]